MTFPSIQTNPITSDFGWNGRAGRYVDLSSGRFVSSLQVRDALESVMGAARDNMHTLTQSLIDQQISLADWQSGMMDQIRLAHVSAGASANGGWAQMSQSDWGATGRMIRDQNDYLRNFAGQIADGSQRLDGRALVRADMYGEAARGTFEQMRRRYEEINNGMDEEAAELGEADHCDDCLDRAAQGWQPIGTLPRIGDSVCTTRCHCTFKFRNSQTGQTSEEE